MATSGKVAKLTAHAGTAGASYCDAHRAALIGHQCLAS
jgi:hypothetical protein